MVIPSRPTPSMKRDAVSDVNAGSKSPAEVNP